MNMADKKRFMQNEDPIEKNQYDVVRQKAGIRARRRREETLHSNKDAEDGTSSGQTYFL